MPGGGLHLSITPGPNGSGKAGSKLWRMAYRFRGRQKTASIGPYGNDNDGTVSLAAARQKRDAADVIWRGQFCRTRIKPSFVVLSRSSLTNDGLEQEFKRFRWLEGGVCTTCAPGNQGRPLEGKCRRSFPEVM
ncbi:Arm DNA-binding domain-containing protein [Bradyrhizobium centrolobii]|uniref:Arm DNA-binding domain-containing protein n=1 Tax=Bradyrhizobium centrolobii TaxID=1505087 RepID=UPI003D312DF8